MLYTKQAVQWTHINATQHSKSYETFFIWHYFKNREKFDRLDTVTGRDQKWMHEKGTDLFGSQRETALEIRMINQPHKG